MYLKRKEKNVDQHTSVALGSQNKDNTNNDVIKCVLSLEELKEIPVAKRNEAETKRYKHLMYLKKKENQKETLICIKGSANEMSSKNTFLSSSEKPNKSQCVSEQEEKRIKWKINKSRNRKRKQEEDESGYNKSRALEKAKERKKSKEINIVAYNKSRALEKAKGREKSKELV